MSGQDILKTIEYALPPITTLLAGYIGVVYGLKQIRVQKRLDFVKQQLEEFYSPLLGLHKEIRAKSELRLKIETTGGEWWKKQVAEGLHPSIEPTHKEIEYNNRQLDEEFIPAYREMLKIFKSKYWLAEPETRTHYVELVEFVEGWNRWKGEGVTAEVMQIIGHTEERVKPFYLELEKRTDILRNELAKKG